MWKVIKGAPRKTMLSSLVEVQPGERLATTSELNPASSPVTGCDEARGMGGGEVVVSDGKIKRLVLEFAGLMALSFLALPVIPTLKITDKGLYEITEQGIAKKEVVVEIR